MEEEEAKEVALSKPMVVETFMAILICPEQFKSRDIANERRREEEEEETVLDTMHVPQGRYL